MINNANPGHNLLVISMMCIVLTMPFNFVVPAGANHEISITQNNQLEEEFLSPSHPAPLIGNSPQVIWQQFNSPNQSGLYGCVKFYDFDHDGIQDMVAGNFAGGISMWTGDGLGNWTMFSPPITSMNFYDFALGDINNDGLSDIVAGYDKGMLAWTGDGSGTWTNVTVGLPNEYVGPLFPIYSVVLDDMNLDGNLDIVGGNNGKSGAQSIQAVRVFMGNGNGVWTDASSNLPAVNGLKYFGIATGDFNRDGWPDIVGAGSAGIDAWIGNGGSTWTLRDNGLPGSGAYSDVKLADFNLDGNFDLVATGKNNNGLAVSNGDGWGIWTTTYTLPMTGTYTGVEVYDVNIDGYMDIITSSDDSDNIIWTGDGQNNWYLQTNGLRTGDSHSDISVGDINNDARMDICLPNTTGEQNIWYSSVDRTVNAWTELNAPASGGQINDIEIADINMDGKPDICYAKEGGGIELWSGDGTGNWTPMTKPVSTGNYNSIISTDFNKDGKPDIISTSDSGIKVWIGNGGTTWVARTMGLPSSGVYLGLTVADFNDDGDPDIAAGTQASGVAVWNGDGWGIWTMTYNLPFVGTYYDLAARDMNRDGALDLVAAHGGLMVFLGNANDGWSQSSSGLPGSSSQYYSVEVTDLDNDGILDIIGASESAGVNTWLGDGTGSWNFGSNPTSVATTGLATGDFSIDGTPDIVFGSGTNNGINGLARKQPAWETVSDGLFQSGDFRTIELADINIDGRLDIITANYTAGTPNIWVGDYAVPPPETFSIGPLSVGWNLVSTPLAPSDTALPGALTDLDGDTSWTRVKYYDNAASPAWKTYGPSITSTLTDITEKMGVWIYIPDAGSLGDGYIRLEGSAPTATTIDLVPGWNLVGYPSSISRTAGTTVPPQVDIMSVYQSASPYIQDFTAYSGVSMIPGNAYWIHVNSASTWVVDY
ncbi:MAG: VCBS repeat-containing protein [Candidatus Thermoplasmatota archaeon]|nr:VCBS repeat-containing protein [Euryarchaeota archaeon]MBU4031753.1 VCBS repeat-containing protein [Candidatus Thermoplasmatota archaeon]MBU4070908.1 VCBS repeat-containing protein [Candidatus Thermoplasmatota archaeon]MBU4144953.1 VCBS repeat-containing protein [Candidatus Thermoplasmatota archaeon]MBU4591708.1 VCBS repeat-containing protein [Candidatus Thermoplasmatota archaeon]